MTKKYFVELPGARRLGSNWQSELPRAVWQEKAEKLRNDRPSGTECSLAAESWNWSSRNTSGDRSAYVTSNSLVPILPAPSCDRRMRDEWHKPGHVLPHVL